MEMKLNINLDDNEPLYNVLDSIVLGYLKNSLDIIQTKYKSTHPDDIKSDAKVKKALLVLIDYYGG
jgi:hypothetical protein